jgi:hypothetical protein
VSSNRSNPRGAKRKFCTQWLSECLSNLAAYPHIARSRTVLGWCLLSLGDASVSGGAQLTTAQDEKRAQRAPRQAVLRRPVRAGVCRRCLTSIDAAMKTSGGECLA